jgi:hypothetical protein
MAYVFDGAERLISLTLGTVVLDVKDVYSRWKEWMLGTDEGKNARAFLSVGGDPISAGTEIPAYVYLANGWRIRPQEADHTLEVTNGVLLVDGGGDPFVDTIGAFTVRINYQQPVQAISVGLTSEVEPGFDVQAALRLMLAALVGKLSGAPAGPVLIRDVNDTINRIAANVDADGNRTSVTKDIS